MVIEQCATYQHYSIVQACFNISSDLMMLGIAIPLFLKARVPTKKCVTIYHSTPDIRQTNPHHQNTES